MAREDPVLTRLRRICLALPETAECVTFGHPTFRAGKRTFCVLEEYKGHLCICIKTAPAQQGLLSHDPRFFITPYVGQHGWLSYIADGKIDWNLVEDLVVNSFRLVAQKRMLAALDGGDEGPGGASRGSRQVSRRK
jgi:predicted DNA-binding protein (MmcQ/YjbR family)